jgi:hypothetical protein
MEISRKVTVAQVRKSLELRGAKIFVRATVVVLRATSNQASDWITTSGCHFGLCALQKHLHLRLSGVPFYLFEEHGRRDEEREGGVPL